MKLYRYEEENYGEYHIDVRVLLYEFNVRKETPKGYWIRIPYSFKDKWTSNYTRKRFAYPTKEEALVSFIARKRRHTAILRYQLEEADLAHNIAIEMLEKEDYGEVRRLR